MFKKISSIGIALSVCSSIVHAGMIEQVLYNVVGQVSNAVGARLGDEVYYGSSSASSQRVVRHHRRRHHKKRHKKVVAKKVAAPVMNNEKKIQIALTSLGFYKGKIDGEINSYETRSAIKTMNTTYGLGNNAFLSPQVKDSLVYLGDLFKFDRTLILKGSDKKTKGIKIQSALKVLGFYNNKVDGLIGGGTKRSIAEYKSANGMAANGSLDFEEEYRLITKAKETNSKNIDETIASIKAFARVGQPQQVAMQPKPMQQKMSSMPIVNNVNTAAVMQSGQVQQQAGMMRQNITQKSIQTQQAGAIQSMPALQKMPSMSIGNSVNTAAVMHSDQVQQQAGMKHQNITQKTQHPQPAHVEPKQNTQTKEAAANLNATNLMSVQTDIGNVSLPNKASEANLNNATEQSNQAISNQMVQENSAIKAEEGSKETQPIPQNSEQTQQPIEESSAKVAKK